MKKEVYESYFKDKKVTVMGLGLLGRGIGDSQLLVRYCSDLIITDKKTQEELASSVAFFDGNPSVTFHLGGHSMEDFENRDFILKPAGAALDNGFINHAKDNGVPVYMSAALVSSIVMKELPDVTIIGVTGTRGKSTTTQLIAHVLKENGLRVHLGGNVRGVANLPLLDVIEDGDYLVLELDSWQLQGFGDMKISPHIAVFTSFLDDHMNYYNNDKEAYFSDKANIYRNQKEYDILIASNQAEIEIKKRDPSQVVIVPEERVFETHLIGEHNQVSARLVYEVASQCGLDEENIESAIKTFKAVEGRLEDMGEYKGVRVFNDNNGTTGDATVAALKAIVEKYNKKPFLIIGGSDKALPLDELEKVIQENTKEVVYLKGTGTDKLSLPKEYEYERLEECLKQAFTLAEEGDIILYSPAFTSFSQYFNNEYEKNDAFVNSLESYR